MRASASKGTGKPKGVLMAGGDHKKAKPALVALGEPENELPYRVELWEQNGAGIERVLARATTLSLASAIFLAAQTEYPMRRITVRHGQRFVYDTNQRPEPRK